ncbi:MAG TPA: cytochrome c oxidase assembly protein [Opitutaceae bacterium]|nr:cytochrome c oxidase assembly protein [Opitutaceae bacterium]
MKAFSLLLGILALGGLWLGPLPAMTRHSFAAHMALHMGVVAIAAPLLAFGVAGGAADPVRRAPRWFPPIPLSILELVVVWAWHAPALHRAARHAAFGLVAEQATFLLAGLAVWLSAVGGGPARRAERTGAGLVALLLTSMHMTLLGALLALTPRALYAHEAHAATGLSPLEDQHLGGAVMLVVGGASYLAGGLWLAARLVRGRNPRRQEAGA